MTTNQFNVLFVQLGLIFVTVSDAPRWLIVAQGVLFVLVMCSYFYDLAKANK